MKHQPLITKITNYTGSCLRLDTRPGFDFITAQPNTTTTVTGDVFTMLDDRTAEHIVKIKPESILFEYYIWKGDQYVFAGTPQSPKQEVSVKAVIKDTPAKVPVEAAPVSTPKEEPKAEPVVTITEEPKEEAPAETISNDEFFTSTIDSTEEDTPKKTRKKGTRK